MTPEGERVAYATPRHVKRHKTPNRNVSNTHNFISMLQKNLQIVHRIINEHEHNTFVKSFFSPYLYMLYACLLLQTPKYEKAMLWRLRTESEAYQAKPTIIFQIPTLILFRKEQNLKNALHPRHKIPQMASFLKLRDLGVRSSWALNVILWRYNQNLRAGESRHQEHLTMRLGGFTNTKGNLNNWIG